jgi:hypothetical protein
MRTGLAGQLAALLWAWIAIGQHSKALTSRPRVQRGRVDRSVGLTGFMTVSLVMNKEAVMAQGV